MVKYLFIGLCTTPRMPTPNTDT